MPLDTGAIAKEGREAPLEVAFKRAHRAVEALEEQGSILESRLGRLMTEHPTLVPNSLRDGSARPPEPARAEMTRELNELTQRIENATARMRQIAHQLDC